MNFIQGRQLLRFVAEFSTHRTPSKIWVYAKIKEFATEGGKLFSFSVDPLVSKFFLLE